MYDNDTPATALCERRWDKAGVWIGTATDNHISIFITSEWHLQNVPQKFQIYLVFTKIERERGQRIVPFNRLEPDNVWLLLAKCLRWSVISMVAIRYPTCRSSLDTDNFDLVWTRLTHLLFGLLVFFRYQSAVFQQQSFYRRHFFNFFTRMWGKSKQSDLLTHLTKTSLHTCTCIWPFFTVILNIAITRGVSSPTRRIFCGTRTIPGCVGGVQSQRTLLDRSAYFYFLQQQQAQTVGLGTCVCHVVDSDLQNVGSTEECWHLNNPYMLPWSVSYFCFNIKREDVMEVSCFQCLWI